MFNLHIVFAARRRRISWAHLVWSSGMDFWAKGLVIDLVTFVHHLLLGVEAV